MIYEANPGSAAWAIGLATSVDGKTWTKYAGNPVISEDTTRGGAWVKKVGDYYYLWLHKTGDVHLPGYLARYRSSDLITWTPWPRMTMIPRVGTDEGENTMIGGNGDVDITIKDNVAYIFYAGSIDGGSASGTHIKLATANARIIGDW